MSIEVTDIHKAFGDFQALAGVSLKVEPGELVALLGPSGSGKTTLLRIIAGLDFADSGIVAIDGRDTSRVHVKDRRVGFVFQHYALFKHMTVFDNIAFGLRVRPKLSRPSPEEIHGRVMKLLQLVHLERFHDRYPSQLSGGQRQRVALARALAVEPKLLLLDEPFGALDAKVRKELRRWLRRLHEDIGITTIFVTHDQEEAMEVADRVVVMNNGKIEQAGTPEEVYHQPANGFVYDFLGNYNEFIGWRDVRGDVHLAEDDLWSQPTQVVPTAKTRTHWLKRYPEVTGALRKVIPGLKVPGMTTPLVGAPVTRAQMRAVMAERGIPVRVYVRPHEMYVAKTPEEGHHYIPASVIHINPAGSLVTLEMQRKNGAVLQAEVPKTIVDSLGIAKNDIVFVRPKNVRVFE